MLLKRLLLPLFAIFILGCSTDDIETVVPADVPPEIADFKVVGLDLDNVYLYTFNGETELFNQQNLTETSNIAPGYLTLRENEGLLSFYYFSDGAFSVIFEDTVSGISTTFNDFFANTAGRSVAWGINDATNVYFGFFGPFGTRDIGIQSVALESDETNDAFVDFDVNQLFQPVLRSNKIYFSYRDNNGENKFTFYNSQNNSRGPILDFGSTSISFFIAESGNIVIVKNGVDALLEEYDADSLALLETRNLAFNTAFNPGPIDGAVYDGANLFYEFPFTQPARYTFGPAIFNLETQENVQIDFFTLASRVEEELGEVIALTRQRFDPIQQVFFVGYEILGEGTRGGVLQISTAGELISNTTTDFVPVYFVRG